MEAALVSPDFLFRGLSVLWSDSPTGTVTRINESDLASRLSYFLWSSMPDQMLLDLARRGTLSASLVSETERMLADPRAEALVDRFFLQWLRVRDVEVVQPDAKLFQRSFNSELRTAMIRETHASVLTLTSHPTGTSPVKRGQWVLEAILDQAPPL